MDNSIECKILCIQTVCVHNYKFSYIYIMYTSGYHIKFTPVELL